MILALRYRCAFAPHERHAVCVRLVYVLPERLLARCVDVGDALGLQHEPVSRGRGAAHCLVRLMTDWALAKNCRSLAVLSSLPFEQTATSSTAGVRLRIMVRNSRIG